MIDILMTSIAVAIFILLSKIGKFLGCCCIQLSEKKTVLQQFLKGCQSLLAWNHRHWSLD